MGLAGPSLIPYRPTQQCHFVCLVPSMAAVVCTLRMAASSSLVLALDLGTSSTRAALFDSTSQRLVHTTAQQSYPLLTTPDGGAELEPAEVLAALLGCVEQALQAYRDDPKLRGRAIVGIGVSCFWHSLVGLDAAGQPLTRIITWAESRCREDAAELRREHSEKTIHARTGCMLRTSFWPAKLRWLRRTQPRIFARVSRWVSPAEWLQQELCGDANCAIGMATGTGLFNPVKLAWDPTLLDICAVEPSALLPVSDDPAKVGPRIAKWFPELRDAPWFPGIGDGAASNLGSWATEPGLAAINVGTSAALRVMRRGKDARAPLGLFCYRVDSDRFLVGGAVSNAGNLRAWALRELQLDSGAELEDELAARPGPDHGLLVLPFWTAERAPTWNEDQRGAILGFSQHTTALDVLQAITEATYHRLARIAELLISKEPSVPRFLVSGGIQKSRASMQRLADVLGHPVYPNPEPEASIRGAAVFVLEKLTMPIPPLKMGSPIRPRAKIAARYFQERKRQIALEKLLTRNLV